MNKFIPSANFSSSTQQNIAENFIHPIITCIQRKLLWTLRVMFEWTREIMKLAVEKHSGWTSIEYAFESANVDIIKSVISNTILSSFIIHAKNNTNRTLFDMIESVYARAIKNDLFKDKAMLKIYIDLVNKVFDFKEGEISSSQFLTEYAPKFYEVESNVVTNIPKPKILKKMP